MIKFIDILSIFLAGFLINFVSNIENFYSYVKIKSWYSGIIGFICWMLTGLVFADILAYSENKFWLVFTLSLGGGMGNFFSSKILKTYNLLRKKHKTFHIKKKLNFIKALLISKD
ncbi:MAG: hypothetical protein ABDH23_04650 [Endomicrobiia bacterium]